MRLFSTHDKIVVFLVALLLQLLVGSNFNSESFELFFTFFYCATLIMGPYIVFRKGRYLYISIAIASGTLAFNYLARYTQIPAIQITSALLWTLFNTYITALMISYTRRIHRVESDHILVVAISYMLIGITYGALYGVLQYFDNSSFLVPQTIMASEKELWQVLTYYSFMTLTTVGYGDITPQTNLARMVASTEAIMGVMFIGIFVARIVALYTTHRLEKKGEKEED